MTWFKSRYTRHLEEEVARLRAENRAMLNSLLARRGFPPIDLAAAGAPAQKAAPGGFRRGGKRGEARHRAGALWGGARPRSAPEWPRRGRVRSPRWRGETKRQRQ